MTKKIDHNQAALWRNTILFIPPTHIWIFKIFFNDYAKYHINFGINIRHMWFMKTLVKLIEN